MDAKHIHVPMPSIDGSTYCAVCGKTITPPTKQTQPPKQKAAVTRGTG